MIGDAVKYKRLARPVVIPIKVDLTHDEKKIYVGCSFNARQTTDATIRKRVKELKDRLELHD